MYGAELTHFQCRNKAEYTMRQSVTICPGFLKAYIITYKIAHYIPKCYDYRTPISFWCLKISTIKINVYLERSLVQSRVSACLMSYRIVFTLLIFSFCHLFQGARFYLAVPTMCGTAIDRYRERPHAEAERNAWSDNGFVHIHGMTQKTGQGCSRHTTEGMLSLILTWPVGPVCFDLQNVTD